MDNLYIFDSAKKDPLLKFRGGGRIIQILKENFPKAKFINNLNQLPNYHLDDGRHRVGKIVFLNPIFNPFQPPITLKRLAKKQIQMIFDVIPLKYPEHFPIGLRGKFNLWLNKLALRNYDKIVTISHHSKKDISQHLKIPEEKIEVVYPTLSKAFTKPKQPISTDFCLYVGDVNWNKNLVNLAKAIKIINVTCVFVGKAFELLSSSQKTTGGGSGREPAKAQFGDKELKTNQTSVLSSSQTGKEVGDGHLREGNFRQDPLLNHPWQKEFRDFLAEVGDDKRFIFLGYLDDYRLIKLYQQTRVNILVSRDEGFGFSFLEAASQGCPSVLSDIGVFHEIAGDSAWFANPNDPYDIANKIGEIYFNKKLRDELGFKAQKRVKSFTPNVFKKRLEMVIEKT